MPDDRSQPSDPPRHDALDPADQLDVEAVLAEAAGLSGELVGEIGTTDSNAESGAKVQDVEAQLGEVEELLSKVAGGEPDDSAEAADEPESDIAEAASENNAQTDGAEPPDADEDAAAFASLDPNAGEDVDLSEGVEPIEPEAKSPLKVPMGWALGARWRSVREPVARRSLVVLELMVRALLISLDSIDGVFSWINLGARRIIGWIALVIFTAACSITYYSISH